MTSFLQFYSPYPGLRPFQKKEWPIFFGREPIVDTVMDKLAERQLIFVHGSSGCGKSSLIRAGVLPRLEQEHSRHGIVWRTAVMRPGSSPLWNLANAIARIVESVDDDAEPSLKTTRIIRKLLNSGVEALPRIQQRFDIGHSYNACILLDQFEEIFRYARQIGREEVEILIDVLRWFDLDEDSNKMPLQGMHVIVTMRSDHLGDCGNFIGFAELVNNTQYLLPRISDEGLMRAIREPARLFGGDVEVPLIIRLVEESRNEIDALPLVQHALMRLWQKASVAQSTVRQAKSSPNTSQSTTFVLESAEYQGLQYLLSEHADEVLKELRDDDPELEPITQYLFRAISEVDADGRGIRRPQRLEELVTSTGGNEKKLERIINRFSQADCGFLFHEKVVNNPIIDISHEALLRCWNKLDDRTIDQATSMPLGWIRRENAAGDRWKAAVTAINAADHEIARFKAEIVVIAPGMPTFIKLKELAGKYLKDPLGPVIDQLWLKDLPGQGWAARYGGRWGDITQFVRYRRIRTRIFTGLIAVGYAITVLLIFNKLMGAA
jgi:ABC-type dipeptide/oligopeptide/nickel transport system ATPase subunit